ncbi:hypothetical protein [Thiobacillus denitrificans]|uniref:hypothetical protein n=1 Tax=Thiobacillus denitrificans TaxID=36861 RepID=UPI0003A267B3|nr:hypothetical protein [Thiobacillus denitrificans]
MNPMKVRFAGADCVASFDRYTSTMNVAIQLFDAVDGVPVCTATVNVDPLEDGMCAVKNWSENDGMEEALISAGIIESEVCDYQRSGYISAPVYRLTEAAREAVQATVPR